ncbi:MAG: anaerobic ribonucleoside-triphosphate reductase activating protein [Oligoflexia bacterium]|nr:anaerobic ribonucleoside-triphosphate reductase activating protein [Oligoflexia bacterium]
MQIAGVEKNSFIDYPGKIAAVVFTLGCNLNCGYCHNRGLLLSSEWLRTEILNEEVLDFLKGRRTFIEGIVISGGEPTIWPDLQEFISRLKEMGYPVKLDTNGTNPILLKKLISEKMIDYVAMDIKAPFGKYSMICNAHVNLEDIKTSIDILLDLSEEIEYQFRTTLIPDLTLGDIDIIVKQIRNSKRHILQKFRDHKDDYPKDMLNDHYQYVSNSNLYRKLSDGVSYNENV